TSHPPAEPNDRHPVAGRAAVVGTARGSAAACVQGLDRPATSVGPQWLETEVDLPGGGEGRVGYLHLVGGDPAAALADFDRLAADIPGAVAAATALWEAEIAAAFTPGNGRWSGCLPVLRTGNAALRRLYYLGALGVMYMRRDTPASTLRRAYDTLMPRYWQTTTFIWDYMLSSCVHALLDPAPMRQQLALWMSLDIHTHFGTEWQHGSPVGYWYAVNDYAMTRLVREYVRCTGDTGFLDEQFAAASGVRKPVAGHVVDWARAWQGLRGAHGLADYGEMDNLLECVSSYTHEVASFNAANVWALRAAAEIADARSDPSLARRLRQEAAELFARVNALYVPGGWWRSGQPDGSLVPVKHCLDFANVALAAGEDLSPTQRAEMVAFFQRELRTASWLHALSPWDPDASYSRRPDHQWNGAYTAWPAEAALALYRLGRADLVADWLPGLARTANQGPFGQAHFTLDAAPGVAGGAAKAPPQPPYLTDWACSSSGAWVELVLCGVFGLAVPLVGEPTVTPRLSGIDPDATLSGLVLRGRRYAVSASGLRAED
ncbi:MAG: hypothetical protein J2P15_06565, partial [Micromonosporaceae bacterium]|nr:hypothetical protein [Micromonosporaceae bacterium]